MRSINTVMALAAFLFFQAVSICLAQEQQQTAGDPRITIVSPSPGKIFDSGTTIPITVSIDHSLKPATYDINIPGVAVIPGSDYNGGAFFASYIAGGDVAGPVTLIPEIMDTDNVYITGVPMQIVIRPTSALSAITIAPGYYIFNALEDTTHLNVQGQYPGNLQVDYTQGITGTRYASSNNGVVSVDADGLVRATGFGAASVTVRNGSASAHATFIVQDPSHPNQPVDVTGQVSMVPGAITIDQNAVFNQTILITNHTSTPLIGPLDLVLGGLPQSVTLVNSDRTVTMQPVNSQYVGLPLADGLALPANGQINVAIQFVTRERNDIHYKPALYRSSAP